jgi:hypothetical protein
MLLKTLIRAALLLALLFPIAPAIAAQGSGCLPTTGTVSGLTLVQDINAAVAALISSNSGNSAPATDCTSVPIKGQLWLDTSTTPRTVRIYDGANWIPTGTVDDVGHFWVSNQSALKLLGSSSGSITVQPQAATGTYNFNLPAAAGTAGQALLSGGGGSAAQTYGTLGVPAGGTGTTTSTGAGSTVLSASPALTGVPTAPTAAAGDNSTTVATTAFTTAVASLPGGLFRNLKVQATSDTSVTATVDEIVVENPSTHGTLRLIAPSVTISTALSGAGGIDTGSVASSTWYSVWILAQTNGTATGVFSLSSTAPTLPSGFTLQARVGWVRSDASSHLWRTIQYGRRAQIAIGTNPTSPPLLVTTATSVTFPTAVAVGSFSPPTASSIYGSAYGTSNAAQPIYVAPNASYTASLSGTGNVPVIGIGISAGGSMSIAFSFLLESTNIYWGAGAQASIFCNGWEDNL